MRSFFRAGCISQDFWFCQQQKWPCLDLQQGTVLPLQMQNCYCTVGVGTETGAELLPRWQKGHITKQHLLRKNVQATGVPVAV